MMVDEGSWNSASQGVAAEEDNNHANPSEHEESGKGKSDNIRTVPAYVINVPEASACVDTIMEWGASGYKGNSSQELISLFEGNKEEASLKVIGNMMHEGFAHVENRTCDGPKTSKNRPTWTRLARMVVG